MRWVDHAPVPFPPPQANCARRRQGQKVTCFAAVWIIIYIAVQLWRLGGTVDGLDAHISKSGGVSFWCLTDREVNVAERLRLDSLLPTACHYRVVPKGLLIFLGSLCKEVAKTTSGTLVYRFERQTAKKKKLFLRKTLWPRLGMQDFISGTFG